MEDITFCPSNEENSILEQSMNLDIENIEIIAGFKFDENEDKQILKNIFDNVNKEEIEKKIINFQSLKNHIKQKFHISKKIKINFLLINLNIMRIFYQKS